MLLLGASYPGSSAGSGQAAGQLWCRQTLQQLKLSVFFCRVCVCVPAVCALDPQEVEKFLAGANSMDDHFRETPLESNLPVLMGLTSVWNISFLGYPARAILPYCQVSSGASGDMRTHGLGRFAWWYCQAALAAGT